MALVYCPDCGKQVSENCGKCPGCGCPIIPINGGQNVAPQMAPNMQAMPNMPVDGANAGSNKGPNKGLIIGIIVAVVAIIAIVLVIVLGKKDDDEISPEQQEYIEKSRISSDKQLCDTVRSAITTSLLDPDVNDNPAYKVPTPGTYSLSEICNMNVLGQCVEEIIGTDAKGAEAELKSKNAKGSRLMVLLGGEGSIINQVTVYAEDDTSIKAGPGNP